MARPAPLGAAVGKKTEIGTKKPLPEGGLRQIIVQKADEVKY